MNALHRAHGLRFACALGNLLVHAFHEGCFERARSLGAKDHSLRRLAAEPGLSVSYTTLWVSIRVAEQVDLLGPAGRELSVSHHRELFRVEDLQRRQLLAERAVREGWSVRRLRAETGHRQLPPRSPTPPLLRLVDSLERLGLEDTELEGLDELTRVELRERLDAQVRRMQVLVARLSEG